MPFVLDASIALSWYLPGQGSSYAEAVYRRLNAGAEPAAAPLLWRTEIAAVLIKASRRGLLTDARAASKHHSRPRIVDCGRPPGGTASPSINLREQSGTVETFCY